MVSLTLTPAARNAIVHCEQRGLLEAWLVDLHGLQVGDAISHAQLIGLSRSARDDADGHGYSLDSLMKGSRIVQSSSRPKPEPTSQYKALMARLRAEDERRQYERMIYIPAKTETYSQMFPRSISRLASSGGPAANDEDERDAVVYQDADRQLTLVLNVLVSILACGAGIWIIARHWPAPQRLALSFGGSILIAIAEVVIYMGYIRRIKEAKIVEGKKIEVKEVIESWTVKSPIEKNLIEKRIDKQRSDDTSIGGNELRQRKVESSKS